MAVIYASAYGNTSALAQAIRSAGVAVNGRDLVACAYEVLCM